MFSFVKVILQKAQALGAICLQTRKFVFSPQKVFKLNSDVFTDQQIGSRQSEMLRVALSDPSLRQGASAKMV